MDAFATHAVENQPPQFGPRDLWRDYAALREALAREGGGAFSDVVARYGALAGGELLALSFDAHRDRPRLRTHDRPGHRIDTRELHPHYHQALDAAIGGGVRARTWRARRCPPCTARPSRAPAARSPCPTPRGRCWGASRRCANGWRRWRPAGTTRATCRWQASTASRSAWA